MHHKSFGNMKHPKDTSSNELTHSERHISTTIPKPIPISLSKTRDIHKLR